MRNIRDRASLWLTTTTLTALFLLTGCSKIVPEAEAATSSTSAKTSRYWDCCKASGSWPGKAAVSRPVNSCAKDGVTALANPAAQSACTGGTSFMCGNDQPWAVSASLSYGFAAASLVGRTESETLCACYALDFTSGPVTGKTFVAQVIGSGADPDSNRFELLIPGGGVGIFNGCQAQWGAPADGWGNRYGGVSSKDDCAQLPASLRPGCNWRFDWFQNADNPNVNFRRVKCPVELTQKTACTRTDDGAVGK